MTKIYFGALARYTFNSTRQGSGFSVDGQTIELIDTDWHKTIGSYKFVDNEDGTYSSFEVNDGNQEYPIKINRKFNKADLELEIEGGFLIPAKT